MSASEVFCLASKNSWITYIIFAIAFYMFACFWCDSKKGLKSILKLFICEMDTIWTTLSYISAGVQLICTFAAWAKRNTKPSDIFSAIQLTSSCQKASVGSVSVGLLGFQSHKTCCATECAIGQ